MSGEIALGICIPQSLGNFSTVGAEKAQEVFRSLVRCYLSLNVNKDLVFR